MKLNTFLPEVTRMVTFGAAAIMLVAGSSILPGCNKKSTSAPETTGERQSGYVNENAQPESQGTNNGYFWSLYREGGSGSITFGSGGNFAISYSNVTDVVPGDMIS